MEEEKKVSEETKVEIPNANPYSKIREQDDAETEAFANCLLYTSPSPRDVEESRMPSSA